MLFAVNVAVEDVVGAIRSAVGIRHLDRSREFKVHILSWIQPDTRGSPEVSSLGVEIGERRRTLSVEHSTNALVGAEGKGYATMEKRTRNGAIASSEVCYDTLEQWARGKIQAQLQQLLEEEVTTFLSRTRYERRRTVAPIDPPIGSRNSYGNPRAFSMMSGTVTVRRPRVRDLTERFESRVLPLFTRRTQEVGTLLPELYLHGLSTGDFDLALRGLLGEGAPLSPSSIQRLKTRFELDYEAWTKQDLSDLEVVYWWADGLYVKAGIEDRKSALLTIVGALTTGDKVVLACESGERESKESWLKLLRDLKHRGLTFPRLTVADGHLGIWAACGELHPTGTEQRCWNHKVANVLNDLPKTVQRQADERLKAIPYAETQGEGERLRDAFVRTYHKTDKKAVETLLRDWDRLVTFYSFPREHGDTYGRRTSWSRPSLPCVCVQTPLAGTSAWRAPRRSSGKCFESPNSHGEN